MSEWSDREHAHTVLACVANKVSGYEMGALVRSRLSWQIGTRYLHQPLISWSSVGVENVSVCSVLSHVLKRSEVGAPAEPIDGRRALAVLFAVTACVEDSWLQKLTAVMSSTGFFFLFFFFLMKLTLTGSAQIMVTVSWLQTKHLSEIISCLSTVRRLGRWHSAFTVALCFSILGGFRCAWLLLHLDTMVFVS